jgi:hypothetical protein
MEVKMPINPRSSAKKDEFLMELESNNIKAQNLSRSIYLVNNTRVSIRTTTKPGPIYWYDISESINNDVEYIVYQLQSKYHFALFPSSFFRQRMNQLKDSNRPNAKIFYLDSINKLIVSKPSFEEDISEYCCSTENEKSYGTWNAIFS